MTAQIGEKLRYDGKDYTMAAEPFYSYLEEHNIRTASNCTANWRGYYGKWEIKEDKLFLVAISANILKEGKERLRILNPSDIYFTVGMDYFFPGQEEVFAEWFSGVLRIPCGKMLQYVHMGYGSTFEADLFLEFKDGILINKRVVDNRKNAKQEEAGDNLQLEPSAEGSWAAAFVKKIK
jgi:hypothetical protein